MLYVNDEPVRPEEVAREVARLRPQYEQTFADRPKAEREEELVAWSRENVVERVLLKQAARKDPERVPQDRVDQRFRAMVKEYGGRRAFFEYTGLPPEAEERIKQDIALELKAARLCERVQNVTIRPTEEESRAFYQEHLEEFTVPEMLRAAHIIKQVPEHERGIEARDALLAVRARLAAGESFEALVRECSDCPEEDGDLGYFARGQMVPHFEEVVFALETGAVSEVFRTEFGFHIATVRDRRPACVCPFEDAREKIAAAMTAAAREKAMEDFIDTEKAKARIEER